LTAAVSGPSLRWCLIGASDIAATEVLPALRAVGDTAVVVRSGDLRHARAWADRNGVPQAVTDLAAAVGRDDVDAVYVSSVNAQHREHVEAAAAAGKHVLAEKPLALSLTDAEAMVVACRSAGVVMATDHHLPASPTHLTLRRVVREGLIGEVRAVRMHHAVQLPARLAGWRLTDPIGGGVVLDITVHDAAAIAAVLGGHAREVTAVGGNQDNPEGSPFDAVMTSALWDGDVLVQTHDAYNNKHAPTSLHVLGTEGALIAQDCNTGEPVGTVELVRGGRSEPLDVGPRDGLYETTVRAFGAAVRGEGEAVVSGEEGVASLAVALAVQESLRTGRLTPVRYTA
jgi:1,5-anhydro-D-fructose reductase (1,5-anhydro-D-mannitol-forming)